MRTPLNDRLGIEVPIIQAAIGGATCPALAAAVSNAGGLGMLALTGYDNAEARRLIRETRALTARPFGVNLVLGWPDWSHEKCLAVCLSEGVPVVSFFWGNPVPFIAPAHEAGAIVLHTAGSVEEAQHAVAGGVDVIVAQGWEAGGHVRGTIATLPLVRAVVNAVRPALVVAAGGIADGSGLAAVLALGASGAWIGTRFLASEEAAIHPRYRELVLAAKESNTVYTELFDVLWPNAPHRVLCNKTVEGWEAAGRPPPGERPGEDEVVATSSRWQIKRYASMTPVADLEGDIDAMALWAGQGVGLVKRMQPAAAIVREIAQEAESTVRRLAQAIDS
jgi:NAD(P)H-dependent flavin oxidoreductase YrpB (nitropropane dioxygenase family)